MPGEERARPRGGADRGLRARAGRGTARARPSPGRRAPRLTRARNRAGEMVAATTGLLGLSSARRAAILAIVVCALALTVAVPLRNYVAQRQELAEVTERQRVLAAQVEELNQQKARLSNPDEVAAEARSRLGYVRPGEVPYVVQLPAPRTAGAANATDPTIPWYRQLWTDVTQTGATPQ